MEDKFLRIIVTMPHAVSREAERIVGFLEQGYDFVHVRKPEWSACRVQELIETIPLQWRHRIVLHDYHNLARQLGVGATHLNSRNPIATNTLPYSASCHLLEQLDLYPQARYLFLSPIYPSISKKGYMPRYTLSQLGDAVRGRKVVALGGVEPQRFAELQQVGFIGAALMGYAWDNE